MVKTRGQNAQSHPGRPDAPQVRRSSEAVAAEKKAKTDKKSQVAATKAATKKALADLEAKQKADQQNETDSAAKPKVSSKKKVDRSKAPANKGTVVGKVLSKQGKVAKAAPEESMDMEIDSAKPGLVGVVTAVVNIL